MKRLLLLTMILILAVSLSIPDINAATNQQNTNNTTTLINNANTVNNNTNTSKNQSTIVSNDTVNNSITNPNITHDNSTLNVTNESQINNNGTGNIQYAQKAAGSNISSNVQDDWFTTNELTDASGRVKAFIETNNRLPMFVTINSVQVSMPQYLELITTDLVQISNGNTTPVKLGSVEMPNNSTGDINNGTIYKSEYLDLASRISSFTDYMYRAPNYASTTLGKIQYESLVYMYSRIINFYGVNNVLPNWVVVKSLNDTSILNSAGNNNTSTSTTTTTNINTSINNSSNNLNSFTINQITLAAVNVKNFIDENQRLPNYVTVNNQQITTITFLGLLNNALLNVADNNTTLITAQNINNATDPNEDFTTGQINQTEYLNIAYRLQQFMNSNGRAPNYVTTSLGNISYSNLIYMFSKILTFYETNNSRLPNYVSITNSSISPNTSTTSVTNTNTSNSIPAGFAEYLQPTAHCQSDNPTIIAQANSITAGLTSTYAKAEAIFNWVDDDLTYSYYYDTHEGALGALKSGTANCCDTAHLLIALDRAAGLPARYVYGNCQFYDDGLFYGHVWAQVYVNGQWITEDAISSLNTFGVINNWNTSNADIEDIYTELPF